MKGKELSEIIENSESGWKLFTKTDDFELWVKGPDAIPIKLSGNYDDVDLEFVKRKLKGK